MAENPIRFGILGCADIARKLSRAINIAPGAVIHAVGSRSQEKATLFASDNSFPAGAKAYGTYEAVLDDPDVDVAYIPLPTSLHVRWAVLAAQKKKHILLEKPVALNVKELDLILQACQENGVQFMDATMWMHNPRTAKMREFLDDPRRFGQLNTVHSVFTLAAKSDFLNNNIRVKPDLDALGALGDVGWYCTRAVLWTANYELPKTVIASKKPVINEAGVILGCGASLYWEDGKVGSFHCSFLSNLTSDITALGTKGNLHVNDFVIPFEEEKGSFTVASGSGFKELMTGCEPAPSEHIVTTEFPQEVSMVMEISRLVAAVKSGSKPEKKWPIYSRKTQLVLDAIKASIDNGFEEVEVGN
ncbi:uncharacterized oxidoreductase At4g09670-like [Impatiens glandulifera]|uniref:uncharacterized oxidoreductase At4g09670-like n=1 Tax=Impatiens glandulifera TaxID=253017 RepID=UPI001FB0E9BE|nr:uncharacterized oxidoreductase At4g09670-like [Impatiens glandulifera]